MRLIFMVTSLTCLVALSASAQTADETKLRRYEAVRAGDTSMWRFDTETGLVSLCLANKFEQLRGEPLVLCTDWEGSAGRLSELLREANRRRSAAGAFDDLIPPQSGQPTLDFDDVPEAKGPPSPIK